MPAQGLGHCHKSVWELHLEKEVEVLKGQGFQTQLCVSEGQAAV